MAPDSLNRFTLAVRIYYEDTDSGGVVYHANYLKFMERARTEWLRSLGFEQDRLVAEAGVIFAVSSAKIEFKSPARFNDALRVESGLKQMRRVSMLFKQQIVRDADDAVLCAADIHVACIDVSRFRPTRIPQNLIMRLSDVV